ncbi:MAG: hypothetical protein WDM80_17095 [Limisphaerales bacterium]
MPKQAKAQAQHESAALLALVNRQDQERAEELFSRGEAAGAVAKLARILRRDPTDRPPPNACSLPWRCDRFSCQRGKRPTWAGPS